MRVFKSTSLADQVFEKLENDIIQGVYPKGEILTELKLAEQLGVSRTPIREALRRLEQERLIEDMGKGSLVLGITENDLEDIMSIRERTEGLAAYYATINMTDEGVLIDTLIPLHRKTRRYRRIAMEDRNRSAKTMKEHRAMYEAIISGDANLAMELTTQHIANAKIYMLEGVV